VRRAPASPLARLQAKPIEREWYVDDAIPTLDLPVSIIWGEADRVLPIAYARSFAPLFRRSRLEALPSCGHIPQRECPDALAAALLRALGDPPPAAPAPSTTPEPDRRP
jgi:pimeloyl-ACP methyl ester carboxylesterase